VRVLGVDPGLTRCGVGVVEGGPGKSLSLVEVTVIRTDAHADLTDRLCEIERQLTEICERTSPDAVAVERVFSQHNVRSVMGTAQAGAVAVLVAGRLAVPVGWHTPTEVKAAVTGSGRAEKEQVATMVRRLLRLPANPTPADAADALALAICHAWRAPALARLTAARVPRGASGEPADRQLRRIR
jgi:crossover junction endodeoxyribonuclease RuvC